jgi:hypothetical protein
MAASRFKQVIQERDHGTQSGRRFNLLAFGLKAPAGLLTDVVLACLQPIRHIRAKHSLRDVISDISIFEEDARKNA